MSEKEMTKLENNKISVVLPVYNGEKTLAKAIESVLNQTYKNFELIIVNDCSTDGTGEIISLYKEKDARIVVINNEENLRLPKSLNKGFSIATGQYYTWTSDDNVYHPNALQVLVGKLLDNQNIDMVYSDMNVVDLEGNFLWAHCEKNPEAIKNRNVIGACFLYRRSIAKKVGEYDPEMIYVEDYDYWLRIYLNGNIMHVDENLYDYGWHDNSLTMKRKNEVNRIQLQLKKKYQYDLLKRCTSQVARNKYYWSVLAIVSGKEKTNLRVQFYKEDKNFATADLYESFYRKAPQSIKWIMDNVQKYILNNKKKENYFQE